jgi:ATP-dependent Clp protease ATP-binding subunit ClpC
VLDLLDPVVANDALAQVHPDLDPGDLARPAAVLLCALVRGQPLQRGNQQVALAAMVQFLALNGHELESGPAQEVVALIAGAGAGALGAADVAGWLAPRLRPIGLPTASEKKEELMRPRPALPLGERIRKATARKKPEGRFQRFTDRARRAVYLATEEAQLLRHGHVGTEHLLLGLVFEDEGLAAKALESLGMSLAEVRHQVIAITGHGQHASPPHIPFTPQAKRVLELSLREALSLGHNYVGTEHLLLALLREERGIGARVLVGLGASHDQVREEATLEAEDFEAAKALRDRERELLAEKMRLERQREGARDVLQAVLTENQQLHSELDRLRGLLRDHGIEPDGGTARPA